MPLYSNVFSLYREWPGVLSVQLKRNRLPVKVQPDAVLQAEIEKAVSQTVKVQLLTGSTAAVPHTNLYRSAGMRREEST